MTQKTTHGKWKIFLLTLLILTANGITTYATEAGEESVINNSVETVNAEELDLGDYQSSMQVGERQLLTVTVLPQNATEQTITYSSSDEQVATVNGMGRITAKSVGSTIITVKCQKIREKFTLNVQEAEPATENSEIMVTNIEIASHEDTVEVDKSMSLSATVVPASATDTTVAFSSDNSAVATVSSTGEVQGIAPGNVTITVTAGAVSKTIPLQVKIATSAIQLNKSCIVLKCGESQKITATVQPAGAAQTVSFQSADTSIATVSADGTVTGDQLGSTTILVSNGDMSNAVTVIVNNGTEEADQAEQNNGTDITAKSETITEDEQFLIEQLKPSDSVTIKAEEYPILTSAILKALYETHSGLIIIAEDYQLTIDGDEIVNYENELHTIVPLNTETEGLSFELNEGQFLPGAVTLMLSNSDAARYVYLYNPAKKKYQLIAAADMSAITLDTTGEYLLTNHKLEGVKLQILLILIGVILVIALAFGYICIKKKYWFW